MEAWTVVLGVMIAYCIACLVIGYAGLKVGKIDVEDFFLGGRTFGFAVAYLLYVSTFHSSFAFMGSVGWIYSMGITFFATFSSCIVSPLMYYVLGYRIWLLGKKHGFITPADLLGDYYQSNLVRVIISILGLVFVIPYIQAQMIGAGYILEIGTGGRIPYLWGCIILLAVIMGYVWLGGLRAAAWTDVLQGVLMFAMVWVGGIFVTYAALGTTDFTTVFQKIEQTYPKLLVVPDAYWPVYTTLFISLVGISIYPPIWMSAYTARSPKILKWLSVTSPLYLIWFYLPCFLVAWAGKIALPPVARPDTVFPLMLMKYAPAWLAALTLAGGIAACMSTADAQLVSCSAMFTRDLYQRFIKPDAKAKTILLVGRTLIVIFGFVSVALALLVPGLIVSVVALALGGCLQMMPSLIGAVYWPRGTKAGAVSGLVVGIVVLVLTQFIWPGPFGIMSGAWAIISNSLVYVLVSYATKPPSEEVRAKFHGYLNSVVHKP